MRYKKIDPALLTAKPFTMFDKDWALLSAGNEEKCNSMIVSWGAAGTLWGRPCAFAFVRPQRYTFEFMEREELFTLSFYSPDQHPAIAPFGSKSGRDCDKYDLTGISPVPVDGTVFTEGAKSVLVCRKIAKQDIDPSGFLDPTIAPDCYPANDYHRLYVGEIVAVLVPEEE